MTSIAKPASAGALSLRKTRGMVMAAYTVLVFVSFLHQRSPSANAQEMQPPTTNQTNAAAGTVNSSNPERIRVPPLLLPPYHADLTDNSSKPEAILSGISLEIRCTNEFLKVGDEIPIQFIISNHGTEDYKYVDTKYFAPIGGMDEFKLIAKTTSGESLPDPRKHTQGHPAFGGPLNILHPGASFSLIIPLNLRALLKEPGRYEVVGTYLGNPIAEQRSLLAAELSFKAATLASPFPGSHIAPVSAAPISITVLPRTKMEMQDYIQGLTNQVAARLALRAGKKAGWLDAELRPLVMKLMYTCRPEIVPTLLRTMYADDSVGQWPDASEALLSYAPHTAETRRAILQAATNNGLSMKMMGLILNYDFDGNDLKPIIERSLAADNPGEWRAGAGLAGHSYYDDAFTARLIVIASGTNNQLFSRESAIEALACNRTDAGVKTLKTLLNDPDPQFRAQLAWAIRMGCSSIKTATGRHLQPEDFDAKDMSSFIELMLASTNALNRAEGVNLAGLFGYDALTPKLVVLAMDRRFYPRDGAMYA